VKDYHIQTPAQLKAALHSLRRDQKLSQSAFGRKVGLSQERISVIENHPERVTTDQLLTLLMAMGMELVIKPRSLEVKPPGIW
jgi:HTH-type transcriptional regulator/antitoxin HipB